MIRGVLLNPKNPPESQVTGGLGIQKNHAQNKLKHYDGLHNPSPSGRPFPAGRWAPQRFPSDEKFQPSNLRIGGVGEPSN